jgi:hypothetical protein
LFSKFQYNLKVSEESGTETENTSAFATYRELVGDRHKITPVEKQDLLKQLSIRNEPVVWVCLEEEDHDPGRFWLKLVSSVRKIVPNSGEALLDGLVDHHTQPLFSSLKKIIDVVQQNDILLVLENFNYIQATSWWQSTLESITNQNLPFQWIGFDYHLLEIDLEQNLDSEALSPLLIWDVFWFDWLKSKKAFATKEFINKFEQLGLLSFTTEDYSIPIHVWSQLIDRKKITNELKEQTTLQSELLSWLFSNDEWLEGIRILIQSKEFEKAGDILEKNGAGWLEQGFEPLEMLFWLRELPSVLLESRPVLCWLAAQACKEMNLKFLMSFYINHAENSLTSLTRFSRNQDQWLQIEINEDGLKIGAILEKLNLLKN